MIVAYSRGDGTGQLRDCLGDRDAATPKGRDASWARTDPVHRWLQTLWSGGSSSGMWQRPPPRWPWRAVVRYRSWRQPSLTTYPPVDAATRVSGWWSSPSTSLTGSRQPVVPAELEPAAADLSDQGSRCLADIRASQRPWGGKSASSRPAS